MNEFKAFILDDEKAIRDLLIQILELKKIEAKAFSTPEELLTHLFPSAIVIPEQMPDLLIIDLQLQPGGKTGIDLIRELAERDVPSAIMAISGVIPHSEFASNAICFGAAVLLPKPFSIEEFLEKSSKLARIGKNRRKRRIEDQKSRLELRDPTRKHRPVFISYADEDKNYANGLRRHIESLGINVWYAPTTIEVGEIWIDEIENGIDDASIFVPILTDHFFASSICRDELERFLKRKEQDIQNKLLFLPIVGKLSKRGQVHELFRSIAETYQYIHLFPWTADNVLKIFEMEYISIYLYTMFYEQICCNL